MKTNREMINVENYKKLCEEIYSEIVVTARKKLDPHLNSNQHSLVSNLEEEVFKHTLIKLSQQIAILAHAGAKGEDIKEYMSMVTPIIDKIEIISSKIQNFEVFVNEFEEKEKRLLEEMDELEIELLGKKRSSLVATNDGE